MESAPTAAFFRRKLGKEHTILVCAFYIVCAIFVCLIIVMAHGRSPYAINYIASFLCLLSFEKESRAKKKVGRDNYLIYFI